MSRQSKKGCKAMKCVKTIKPDTLICPEPREISTKAKVGATVGAIVGGVCGGEAGAVIGGVIGYSIGKSLDPRNMIYPLYRK